MIDTSLVDYSNIGEYPIIYSIDEKSYELNVEIVDKTAPNFDVIVGETDKDIELDPEKLVTNIQDETKTTVTFEEKYDFTKEGDMTVEVVVTDEGNNTTKKSTTIHILPKDEVKPTVSYEKNITLQKGATFNPLDTIQLKDNQDPHPQVKIVSSELDTNKIGKYEIEYMGTDRSKNEIEFTQTIEIVERKEIGREDSNGENIVYLTFDDGPSYNTPKVLEILNHYKVKATFFVTGTNPEYNHYIQQAYNEGHTIGLHTYSHDYASVYRSTKDYFDDLKKYQIW